MHHSLTPTSPHPAAPPPNPFPQVNSLQRFYPPQQLQAVAQRVAALDFQALAARWRMPVELALDFCSLALYDVILYCDDSGSMAFEVGGRRARARPGSAAGAEWRCRRATRCSRRERASNRGVACALHRKTGHFTRYKWPGSRAWGAPGLCATQDWSPFLPTSKPCLRYSTAHNLKYGSKPKPSLPPGRRREDRGPEGHPGACGRGGCCGKRRAACAPVWPVGVGASDAFPLASQPHQRPALDGCILLAGQLVPSCASTGSAPFTHAAAAMTPPPRRRCLRCLTTTASWCAS